MGRTTYNYGNTGGAGDARSSYTGGSVYYDFGMPRPRVAANGQSPCIIVNMVGVMGGRGSTTVEGQIFNLTRGNGIGSGAVPLPNASEANNVLDLQLGGILAYWNDSIRAQFVTPGLMYYARNSGGPGNTYTSTGDVRPGSLAGNITYVESPGAPTIVQIDHSADGTKAYVQFFGNGDDGGTSVTGWRLQYSSRADFADGGITIDAGGGVNTISGLTPGATYYYRVCGRNWVTDTAGTTGPWSGVAGHAQPYAGAGYRRSGTVWQKAQARRWSGSSWVQARGRRYNGSSWVNL
jgi:hypothetical protein